MPAAGVGEVRDVVNLTADDGIPLAGHGELPQGVLVLGRQLRSTAGHPAHFQREQVYHRQLAPDLQPIEITAVEVFKNKSHDEGVQQAAVELSDLQAGNVAHESLKPKDVHK